MLEEWKELRRLKREMAGIMRRYALKLKAATDEERETIEDERESDMARPLILYELLESERLTRKAQRLGVEIKRESDWSQSWITDASWLNNVGHAKLRKMIRDERFNIAEKWIKILIPV